MIWAVTVVPMSAPKIMPIDCGNVSSPAEIKPTTRTVVTDEDWMTAVTNAPVKTALNRLVVSRASSVFILPPAILFRASVIWSRPYKNKANPPSSPIIIEPTAKVSTVLIVSITFKAIPEKQFCQRPYGVGRIPYQNSYAARNTPYFWEI